MTSHVPSCAGRCVLAHAGLAVAACIASLAIASRSAAWASEPADSARGFVTQNCLDCHQGDSAEGGLDLEQLGTDLADDAIFARWERIFDRVAAGEMPPPDYDEVEAPQKHAFLESAQDWLQQTQLAQHAQLGRVRGRRLTNQQLQRTLHDLLAIDVPLAELMPEEPRTNGFTNIANGQSMSHFQLENHLSVVDAALDAAFARVTGGQADAWRREYSASDLARRNPQRRCREPEMRESLAVVWNAAVAYYGRIDSTTAKKSGWYRVTLTASSIKQPDSGGVWCSVRSGRCTSGAPLLTWVGAFEATEEPSEVTFDAWLPAGHMFEIRPADATLKKARFQGGQVGSGEGEPQNVPGLGIHSLTMQEIHPGGSQELARRRLFGDLPVHYDTRAKQLKLGSQHPSQAVAKQLVNFAQRALRRDLSEDDLQPYLQLLEQKIDAGVDPIESLRAAYRAVLCSPRFMYFVEQPGRLDDFAIASRLSYMLTGSMPDDTLRRLAQEGQLNDPNVLHEQVERLLAAPGGRDFVERFTAQWLDLVDIDFTEPDRKLHPDFDSVVQNAMLAETQAYVQHLLEHDLPAAELLDSNYSFLNSRLARYYGIEGITGDQLRKVKLPADSHRGGLLGHGSILKVTANGTNTSPVLRGIWVSERLLGQPIPAPPENIPAIEPDIRGATTIREILEKHKSDDSCASCHVKIDPPGYALENFDAAGQWRDKYVVVNRGRKGQGVTIDASHQLPDGREFEDIDSFRKLWRDKPQSVAKGFAEKLLIFGTGADICFTDRTSIESALEQNREGQYGLRSLLHSVVTSEAFLKK